MIGFIRLEVYIFIFNITQLKNKFKLHTDSFDECSFEELKNEVEEIINISDITPQDLQHEKIGPRIIEVYKKLRLEKSGTDGYITLFLGYARSTSRGFESYLRIVVGLDEKYIQLI